MLLTNHALTGAVLALAIPDPVILMPVAFASHLALDSLPHFGRVAWLGDYFDTTAGKIFGVSDCALALASALLVVHRFPQHFGIITLGVFFACLPDLFYVPQVLFGVVLDKKFRKLHAAVQWGEFPGGIAIDGMWAAGMIYLLQSMR